jgi:multisubunit Na+/H+ antiporter MnhG subunit
MLKPRDLGSVVAGVGIAAAAVVADALANIKYVTRNATPEELASVLLTLVLTLGAWTRAWQFFAFGPGRSVMFPSSILEVVVWSLLAPVWARMVWRSAARAAYDRREAAHVLEKFDTLEASHVRLATDHAELLIVHDRCQEPDTGRHARSDLIQA